MTHKIMARVHKKMIEEQQTNVNKKVIKKGGGKRAQKNDGTAHQKELQTGEQKIEERVKIEWTKE